MIFFRCDGGAVVGLGHIVRSCIFGKTFYDLTKKQPSFITFSSPEIISKYINKDYFNIINSNSRLGTDQDTEFVTNVLEKDSILIVDSRFVRQKDIDLWANRSFLIGIDDDFNNLKWPVKLDYNLYSEKNSLNDLIGPEFNLINSKFFIEDINNIGFTPKILITMGGEDPDNLTSWIIENSAEILKNFEVRIVIGIAHPEASKVKQHASRFLPNAKIIENSSSLIDHAIWSNIAITAGGMTAYELAVSGNALLGIALDNHQIPLIKSMEKVGAMYSLGAYSSIKERDLRESLRKLINDPIKADNLRIAAMKLFPASGARYAASKILELQKGIGEK